jgi:hypothetical protein
MHFSFPLFFLYISPHLMSLDLITVSSSSSSSSFHKIIQNDRSKIFRGGWNRTRDNQISRIIGALTKEICRTFTRNSPKPTPHDICV